MIRVSLAALLLAVSAAAAHGTSGSGGEAPVQATQGGVQAPAQTTQGGVEATVEAAQSLLADGDNSGALATAERVLAADPLNVEAHHVVQAVLRARDRAAMLSRYAELARRYPGSAAAQYLYGNALLNAGERTSHDYFQRALRLDPNFGWAASIEAIYAQLRGDSDEALRLARIGADDIRHDLSLATTYADLLRLNGLRDEAIRYLEQAAALNPGDPRFLLEVWRLRMRGVEDYEAERAAFAWQVEANRSRFLASPEMTAALASFYNSSAMADRDGARQLWLELANRFPAHPEAKGALLRAASMTEELDARFELYDRLLNEYPESAVRYAVHYRMLRDLINAHQYDRARRLARDLTTAIDPGRADDDPQGRHETSTDWGYTLQGIGYVGWFEAAQAKAAAPRDTRRSNLYTIGEAEQPVAPDALAAARSLEASDCNDPRSLAWIADVLLDSSYYRDLGLRLMERAQRAAAGDDPLIVQAYGVEELADTRRDLERELRELPLYYALAGQIGRAVQLVEQMLAELRPLGTPMFGANPARMHYIAAKVFDLAGRREEAARHHMISEWYSPSGTRQMARGVIDDIARIYDEIATPDIERFAPGEGPRVPVMSLGLRPVEGAATLAAQDLGGDLLLLVFWARWNARSIEQVLALDALSLSLGDPRLSTLAVGVERSVSFRASRNAESYDQFTLFRSSNVLTIALAGADLDTIDQLELVGLPTTILLDRTGRVRARQLGFHMDRGEWSRQWRAIVQEELARVETARLR